MPTILLIALAILATANILVGGYLLFVKDEFAAAITFVSGVFLLLGILISQAPHP